MVEKSYVVQILDPAQGELEEIARLYLSLSGVRSASWTLVCLATSSTPSSLSGQLL